MCKNNKYFSCRSRKCHIKNPVPSPTVQNVTHTAHNTSKKKAKCQYPLHPQSIFPPLAGESAAYDGIGKNTVCQRQNHRMPAHLTYNIFLSASRTFVIKKK